MLENGRLAIIENPLRRIPEEEVNGYIKSFHEENGLGIGIDLNTLVRGARLARDEEAFVQEEAGNLTEVESAALKKEKCTTIWSESREIKIILLTCCVGSIIQGWGAIIAANQTWPEELLKTLTPTNGPTQPGGSSKDTWLFSATNAIVYFAASSVGAFLCDPLTEIFVGRRGAIFVAGLFTFIASIGEAFTHSWQTLFACRL
ncbi:MAG: hypothetical protein Q9172_001102 [Xanthocarpia lactea]